jgi:sporulation protein YlmC with PRC-barrel domain
MLETYGIEELRGLVGHEVVDMSGESIGYVDLVFIDSDTGRPEWLGIWNGLWQTRPRVLVPIQGIEHVEDEILVPWTKEVVMSAPDYDEEDDRGVVADHEDVIGISPEKERAVYSHYGLEPVGSTDAARLRAWDVSERASERVTQR